MNHLKYILGCASIAVAGLTFEPLMAQSTQTSDGFPSIIAPTKQTVSYRERTLCFDITANVPFTATSSADWAIVRQGQDGAVYIHLNSNPNATSRQAVITFANADNSLSEKLTITQSRNELAPEIESDTQVKPSSAQANKYQSGEGIERTYDNNLSTLFHSPYTGYEVSEKNPITLTYNFSSAKHIDYINYITRPSSNTNGNFKEIEVYAKYGDDSSLRLIGSADFGGTAGEHRYTLTDNGLDNVKQIQIKVLSGTGGWASCAEMQFCIRGQKSDVGVFTDASYSALKEGTTQADIDAIDDDFTAQLAQQLFDKTYSTDYRVAEYDAKLDPTVQSDLWNAPGKLYDQAHGVTGINITKGKHTIAVSGLPNDDASVNLQVIAWYVGKYGSNFDGGNPAEYSFTLRNGLNIINYEGDYDGLAYVAYYASANPELQPKIKVHFINGQVNGYLSLDKTNEQMHEICKNAPNFCLDVVGTNVHSVWTSKGAVNPSNNSRVSQGLYGNCVAVDGTSLGYRQFIHVLDSLVIWEHELLGLHKYNRTPDNRTMAYVNFTYYMFQGGRGVSFHVDQEPRVLSCKKLITSDDDAIWGLSHEWGHQHQMQPYFCWAGMGEVTNNMNSYYNIMRMGYRSSDKINQWTPARKHFINADYSDIEASYKGSSAKGSRNSNMRYRAYTERSSLSHESLRKFCETMVDSTITDYATDPTHALALNEVGVGETLCPFIKLYSYFTTNGKPDFAPDWYESLRQNDDENGSQVEKQGAADKYEILASVQNNNKNSKYKTFLSLYPNSVWNTKKYVDANSTRWENSIPYVLNYIRKTSRLSGYNLLPYFERWGFVRQVALCIGDYGNKWFILTPEMYNEFKEDMDALVTSGELKEMPDGMVEDISNCPEMFQTRPTFEN